MTLSVRNFPSAEVIVDQSAHDGRFNMSMDAAMLQLGGVRDSSIIRVYKWSRPTVTLGYFQGAGKTEDSPFPGIRIVRRLSGGGAILHDQELTYSCVLPGSHPLRHNPSEIYGLIHQGIIELLSLCGVPCSLRSTFEKSRQFNAVEVTSDTQGPPEPFLCFLRTNHNDIVHSSGVKIVGSAQRRRKGITLQHGSILLSASSLTPDLPGIRQLQPNWNSAMFEAELPQTIAKSVADLWSFRTYTSEELSIASEICGQADER